MWTYVLPMHFWRMSFGTNGASYNTHIDNRPFSTKIVHSVGKESDNLQTYVAVASYSYASAGYSLRSLA